MSEAEYAIYSALTTKEKYKEKIDTEKEAENISRSIIDTIKKEIEIYNGWKDNKEMRDEVRTKIIMTLVQEGKGDIYDVNGSIDEIQNYILENYEG